MTHKELLDRLHYNPDTGEFHFIKGWRKTGTPGKEGYLLIRTMGKQYRAHRLAWFYVNGQFPKYGIDHINRINTDNRICNLRDVDQVINARNKVQPHGAHKTTARHVTYSTRCNRWLVKFRVGRKEVYYESFLNKEEAELKAATLKRFFHPEAFDFEGQKTESATV